MELNYVNFVCVFKLTNENHFQARLAEIEARHGVEAESREAVRRLTRRRSRSDEIGDDHHHDGDDEDDHDDHDNVYLCLYFRRETRAMVSELRHTGTLRRSHRRVFARLDFS